MLELLSGGTRWLSPRPLQQALGVHEGRNERSLRDLLHLCLMPSQEDRPHSMQMVTQYLDELLKNMRSPSDLRPVVEAEATAQKSQGLGMSQSELARLHWYLGKARMNRFQRFTTGLGANGAACECEKSPQELLESSVRDLHECVRLDPSSSHFRADLASALVSIGDMDGATTQLELAVKVEKCDPRLRHQLGLLYAMSGHRLGDALVHLRRAVLLCDAKCGSQSSRLSLSDQAYHEYLDAYIQLLDRQLCGIDASAAAWRRVSGIEPLQALRTMADIQSASNGGSSPSLRKTPRSGGRDLCPQTPRKSGGPMSPVQEFSPLSPGGSPGRVRLARNNSDNGRPSRLQLNELIEDYHFGCLSCDEQLPPPQPSSSTSSQSSQKIVAAPRPRSQTTLNGRKSLTRVVPTASDREVPDQFPIVAAGKPVYKIVRLNGEGPVLQTYSGDWLFIAQADAMDSSRYSNGSITPTKRTTGLDGAFAAVHLQFPARPNSAKDDKLPLLKKDRSERVPKSRTRPPIQQAPQPPPELSVDERKTRALLRQLANAAKVSGHRNVQGIKDTIVGGCDLLIIWWV